MIIRMKSSLYVAMVSALAVMACGGNRNPVVDDETFSYQDYEVNCPVKSIDFRSYEATSKFGDVIKGDPTYGNYLAEFNAVGNIVKKTEYMKDGEIFLVYRYVYDDLDNLAEWIVYSGTGEQSSMTKMEYNADGDQIRWTRYGEDSKMQACCDMEYSQGYKVKSVREDYEDSTKVVQKWIFKREGPRVLEAYNYTDDVLKSVFMYSKYDEKGIIEGVEYDGNDAKISEFRFEYNPDGYLMKATSVSSVDDSEHELLIERNDKNLPLHNMNSENDPVDTYYEYEYDEKGNWVRRVEFEGIIKKPVEIVERTIAY